MSKLHRLTYTAVCITLGVVLPLAFHAIPNGGRIFLPMHIPVYLAGLVLGPLSGVACGLVVPVLSSLITGMPVPGLLPAMMVELTMYGLVSGLLSQWVKRFSPWLNIFIALIGAMVIGRVIAGTAQALIFSAGYSWQAFASGYLITGIIGIVIQLILIPPVVLAVRHRQRLSGNKN